jgi:hypothetical protein
MLFFARYPFSVTISGRAPDRNATAILPIRTLSPQRLRRSRSCQAGRNRLYQCADGDSIVRLPTTWRRAGCPGQCRLGRRLHAAGTDRYPWHLGNLHNWKSSWRWPYHDLCLHPRLIGIVIGVQPIVDKDEFSVGFRFISQAIFGASSRSFERNLLATHAVETVTGAKISVEFKAAQLFLQLRDLSVCLAQEVICRLRGQLSLKLRPDLV